MNTYEVKFIFNSKKENKYEALAEWYRKANAIKDFDSIEKQRKEK